MIRALLAVLLAAGLAPPAGAQEPEQPEPAPGFVASLTLFAGTESGLWTSSDWGGTWRRLRGPRSGDPIEESGAVHDILTTTSGVYVAADNGLYVSGDFGHSWARYEVGSPSLRVMPSRYPQSDPTLFVGTAAGLLRSPDAGRSFEPTALTGRVERVEWPGPELIVAGEVGVRISLDAATSFGESGRGLPPGPVEALVVSSLYALDPVLLAGPQGGGVYRSSDGGESWRAVGLAGVKVNDLFWFGPFLYAATDDGLFLSQDAGDHFERIGPELRGIALYDLLFPRYPEAGSEIFVSSGRGLFRSLDGGANWQSSGLEDERILVVGTFPPPLRLNEK